ncbi:unnamed protein product, partial [Laminaria digitata]
MQALPACLPARPPFQLPMWVDNDSTADPQGFLSPPSGLFPAPLPPLIAGSDERRLVIGRFRFLGRLAARCLMDEQVLPLPLSMDFLRLV